MPVDYEFRKISSKFVTTYLYILRRDSNAGRRETMMFRPMVACVLSRLMALAGGSALREKVPEMHLIIHAAKGDPESQLSLEPVEMDDGGKEAPVILPVDMVRETEMAIIKAETVYKAAIGQGKDVRTAQELIEKAWFYYSLNDFQTALQLSAEVQNLLMIDT